MAPPIRSRVRALRIVGLFLFSVLSSILLLEAGLRVLDLQPRIAFTPVGRLMLSPNPILGFELDPRYPDISSFGLRDRDFKLEKDEGTERIAVLGDSITFGCCDYPIESTYPKRLEAILNTTSESARYEVINAGVNDYNTLQEAEFYRTKISRLNPDRIIIQFCTNDTRPHGWVLAEMLDAEGHSRRGKPVQRILRRSFVFKYMLYVYLRATAKYNPDASETSDIVQRGFDLLSRSKGADVPVLVVLFPRFNDLGDSGTAWLSRRVTRLARERGFSVLDLRGCYERIDNREPLRFNDGDAIHPNVVGHEVAARCIAHRLKPRQFPLPDQEAVLEFESSVD